MSLIGDNTVVLYLNCDKFELPRKLFFEKNINSGPSPQKIEFKSEVGFWGWGDLGICVFLNPRTDCDVYRGSGTTGINGH